MSLSLVLSLVLSLNLYLSPSPSLLHDLYNTFFLIAGPSGSCYFTLDILV